MIYTILEIRIVGLFFGDFNMILSNSEKIGGNNADTAITNLFNNTLKHCDLI
jgi:hypothetical protein